MSASKKELEKKGIDPMLQPVTEPATSLAIASRGVKTGADFTNLMSAVMSDLIAGRISSQTGNAVCNAGGKLLKVVEMQYRYGTPQAGSTNKVLQLVPNNEGDKS